MEGTNTAISSHRTHSRIKITLISIQWLNAELHEKYIRLGIL